MPSAHKYLLEPYRGQCTRHSCPNCKRQKEFTRYIDTESGLHLAKQVGKCNRESNCGYHYTPREYFLDNPQSGYQDKWRQSDLWQTKYQPPEVKPIDCIPTELMEKTLCNYEKNNFIRYLALLFNKEKALKLAQQFKLGTSRHWKNQCGLAVIFWQIDRHQNIRQAKIMAYHPETGRRLKAHDEALKFSKLQREYYLDQGKSAKVYFAGKSILGKDANLRQCFFGEHQLASRPEAVVAIVESEKTAVIMTGFFPDVIWLATGGTNGARWTDKGIYSVLKGRSVIFYPDLGAYRKWSEKTKVLGTICKVSVSDLLEHKAIDQDHESGFDLADFMVKSFLLRGGRGET